ncbi:MAG: type IV pili twitching motility protein PilT [Chloroflexi bacterium RBG_13_52_14]|nr:MAG: type IV pili twitching motility protein PilT [Chloroflexi bacterium RBG_13_52_14]
MDIHKLIIEAKERKASDIHMAAGAFTTFRIHGDVTRTGEVTPPSSLDMEEILDQLTTPEDREKFHRDKELDFAYSLAGVTRLRCNAAVQQRKICLSMRLIHTEIPTIEDLHIPTICRDLIRRPRGMIMISGPTGSGKSTTLASMLNYLNHEESRRIVTIEDPVEYLFTNNKCTILQRELGDDTHSFAQALKHVLRQDPDVIMVGEMRDPETASAALILAETGHLVLTTGHAPSASQAVDRVIDLFPVQERHFAQTRLASLLIAIMCQALVPTTDEEGRMPAVELMLANVAVKTLIREGKIHQLPNVIRTSAEEGMIMLDESLGRLYKDGLISAKHLLAFCNDRAELEKVIGEIDIKRDVLKKDESFYKFFGGGNSFGNGQPVSEIADETGSP